MRYKFLCLGFAATLILAMAFEYESDAQPPGKKGKGKGQTTITADQIVDRIMSFDKNNDGKITIDELPERMQHLIALGDVNKDGALDKDEIRKLATTLESFVGLTGGGNGPPPGAPKGDGPPKDGFKGKGGPKGPAAEVQRTIDDLNLTGKTRDKAQSVARAHQDKIRRFDELTRAEVIMQMQDVLNDEDFRVFKSALDRGPGPKGFGGPKQDLDRRIDQLQKELDELRRKAAK